MASTTQPGFTPALARSATGRHPCDDQGAIDQAALESGFGSEVRLAANRGIRPRRDEREVRSPEAAEHLAYDLSKLIVVLCGNGPGPEIRLDGVPVHAIHSGIEVRIADDRPDGIECLDALSGLRAWQRDGRNCRGGRGESNPHLIRALI